MRLTAKEVSNGLTLYNLKPHEGEDAIVQQLSYYGAVKKLGQLEDIEEELGIDLVTLFKSVLNGFYAEDENGITFVHRTDVKEKLMLFKESLFKDYGKTWALTKEELQ